MNFSKMLYSVVICCLFTVACSSPEEVKVVPGDGNKPRPPSKPLPSECSELLLVRLNWRGDRKAFAYTIEQGTAAGVYNDTYTLAADQTSFPARLERGTTYYIRATKHFTNGSASVFQTVQIDAPTCGDRVAYQEAHPTYTEPFIQLITWTKK